MQSEIHSLLTLTERPYEEYNDILPEIRSRLDYDRLYVFEQIMLEELPLTTLRRATRTAILIAYGEKAHREYRPPKDNR